MWNHEFSEMKAFTQNILCILFIPVGVQALQFYSRVLYVVSYPNILKYQHNTGNDYRDSTVFG